jgi:hypothetical protein
VPWATAQSVWGARRDGERPRLTYGRTASIRVVNSL